MNCFNHSERVAVGVCKSCGKGLCMDCAAPRANGLACKGACEDRVDFLNKTVDENAQALAVTRYLYKGMGLVSLIMGIVVLAYAGLLSTADGWELTAFMYGCIGLMFLAFGITLLTKKVDTRDQTNEARPSA